LQRVKMKTISLAGAKRAGEATTKALRKLFGRQNSSKEGAALAEGEESGSELTQDSPQPDKQLARDHNDNTDISSSAQLARDVKPDETDNTMRVNQKPLPPIATPDLRQLQNKMATSQQKPAPAVKENQTPVPVSVVSKESQPSAQLIDDLIDHTKRLGVTEVQQPPTEEPKPEEPALRPLTPDELLSEEERAHRADRRKHLVFIEEALDMARLALRINETPVGCVLVHNGRIIARGMNATNVTRNGTRHAELMALNALLSRPGKTGPLTTSLKPKVERNDEDSDDGTSTAATLHFEGNEDGKKGHLYPYGQKEIPDETFDRSIIKECILYVTVEPCVMCASLFRQLGIKKVFFGAVNDKFGGTGGVFSIHANSLPVREDGQTASAHPAPPPMRLPDGKQVLGLSFPPGGGDGGNVEPGYEIEGGWGRDEAVALLRRFYVQENGRAPVPRKKEGRAARLAAIEGGELDGASVNSGYGVGGNGTMADEDEDERVSGYGVSGNNGSMEDLNSPSGDGTALGDASVGWK